VAVRGGGRGGGGGRWEEGGESVLSIRLADVIREIQGPSISDERGERGQLNIGLTKNTTTLDTPLVVFLPLTLRESLDTLNYTTRRARARRFRAPSCVAASPVVVVIVAPSPLRRGWRMI